MTVTGNNSTVSLKDCSRVVYLCSFLTPVCKVSALDEDRNCFSRAVLETTVGDTWLLLPQVMFATYEAVGICITADRWAMDEGVRLLISGSGEVDYTIA